MEFIEMYMYQLGVAFRYVDTDNHVIEEARAISIIEPLRLK